MARISWPPSPCVEDEDVSLAREHGSDTTDSDADHGKAPAASRGTVDQGPHLVDVGSEEDILLQKEKNNKKSGQSSHNATQTSEPLKSHQPHNVKESKPSAPMPLKPTTTLDAPTPEVRPRSNSTTRVEVDQTRQGRPQMHRLKTDLGGDLQAMASGQRRAPSPYAYKAPTTIHQESREERSKTSLLSPESASGLKPSETSTRRSRSVRPERQSVAVESSDSDRKSSRHKHRSRSRHIRTSDPKHTTSAGEEYFSDRRTETRDGYRRSRQSPPRFREERTHRSAHGNITPPQTPSLPRESPYTSAAEDSDRRRRRDKSRGPERRYSKESYGSAVEDTYRREDRDIRSNTGPSRRGSMRRNNRPQLDLSDTYQKGRFDPTAPNTAKTPKALEDYFQKAFDDNQTRHKHSSHHSAQPSPLASPTISPPRTPRGERKSRDYFEQNAPSSPSKPRSRPPSEGENPLKPLTTLLGAATLGASLKAMPTLSRSSTASIETPSSGSMSSAASGQRSCKPSPVHEEPHTTNSRPVSRAGSLNTNDSAQTYRANTVIHQHDRPVSRAGSTASWEDAAYNHRASAFPMRNERPSSRSGLAPSALEHPPMAQRAASYSSSDPQHARPSSRRTYSSNASANVMSASSLHSPPTPSHLSNTAYAANPSSDKGPAPPAPATSSQQRTLSFPPCPQPHAVRGYHNWYTVQGMQTFDICASCASVLGKSAFRDYCVPSWKPASEAITCALSRPWTRIAIARALKEGSANIRLLQELNNLPSGVLPCPGIQREVRKWYHITDPTTKSPIGNFDACTACVRSVELLFPEMIDKIFERPNTKLSQERVCTLNASSKHFYPIFSELEKLASYCRQKDLRPKDIPNFATFIRQKTRYRECAKSSMLATQLWHFIPGLPEFTVCEECYEEFVWPMKDVPIAKDIVPTLQKVTIQRPDHYVAGISCQLYSERMRSIFKTACKRNDFNGFRQNAIMRYNVEHKLQQKHMALEQEARAGYDRREEMERNSALWKTYE